MKQAILDLLASKKFLIFATTAIAAGAARLGFDADKEWIAMILGFGAILIGGYAAADHGKERAKIESEAQYEDDDEDPLV